MKFLIAASLLIISQFSFSQENHFPAINKQIGYQNLITIDSNRTYKPGTGEKDSLHYRPVEIDCWYPAQQNIFSSALHYGDFLRLLQDRSNRFQNDTVYSNISADLIQYLSANLQIKDSARLSLFNTHSYANLNSEPGRFPLIIYFCSYNGMSFENILLFEELAANGYFVACITSVGRYPGNMTMQPEDLSEQALDGEFALKYLSQILPVDTSKIGVIGYSWGGLAAWEMAKSNIHPAALLSLDGSEMHYYGDNFSEDSLFNLFRTSLFSKLPKHTMTISYLESAFKQDDRITDSVFNPLPAQDTAVLYARFNQTTHEYFSCLPTLGHLLSGVQYTGTDYYALVRQYTVHFFNQFLKQQKLEATIQLEHMHQQSLINLNYPIITDHAKSTFILQGTINDLTTHQPVAYANIGIAEKNLGTVSDQQGRFSLAVPVDLIDDQLTVSMIGFENKILPLAGFKKTKDPIEISLNRKISELSEVTVMAKSPKIKTLGNTTESKFVSVGLPLKFLGSETGIKIHLGKKRMLIKSFSFTISDNRLDTALFRLNIYAYKHGKPVDNLLTNPIFVGVGKKTGRHTIPLSQYKLVFSNEILISLEWIEGKSKPSGNGAIFLSAGFLNSATWHRLTSQASWKKATGMGVGFNIDVQEVE